MSKPNASLTPPTVEELLAEIKRVRRQKRVRRTLCSTVLTLILVAALTLGASHFLFPVIRVQGDAMAPTHQNGSIVVLLKGQECTPGHVIAFYAEDKLILRRVIAKGGDEISIAENGGVHVNGQVLHEPYVSEYAMGICDIEMPFTVPAGQVFVMGDQRDTALDSRSTAVGCVAPEQIVGRALVRVWPIRDQK